MSDPVEIWMRALAHGLRHLPEAAQDDILAEVRTAIRDRIEQGLTSEQALAGFGSVATFARSFDEAADFNAAVARRQRLEAIAVLIEELGRSVTIGFGLVSATACVLLATRIVLLAWRMPGWLPYLGAWTLPAAVLTLILLAVAARFSARLAIRRLRAARSL